MLLADFLRHLSVRNPLLMRALGADLAGFQTANHVRHFKQTVPRILAYESLPKGIQAEDPVAPLLAYPQELMAHMGRVPQIRDFQTSLKANPKLHGEVVLIRVALQTTESNELVRGVSDVVARVSTAFSMLTYQPVVFLHVEEVMFGQY
ncbi:hypothetical protein BKA83DRAFT_4485761 [Pisolithus microcarpus]|nr:hypothetical protein BKA83DRAFT_4485761 [Pisolithus microcarpus]